MNEFNIICIKEYGTTLYSKQNILKLLNILESKKAKLFGFDGFVVIPEGKRIDQDYSIDFSRDPYQNVDYTSKEVYTIAKNFIEKINIEVLFEPIYETD